MAQYDGILLCSKPFGMTSHAVVSNLRQIIGQEKIGHTGTLDPRATGLLIICLGRATKIAQFLSDMDKSYEAEIKLGERSSTYDSEGIFEDTEPQSIPELTEDIIRDILLEFKGKIKPRVPAFSAIKVDGQRLYKMARRGKAVERPEREIEIKDIALIKMDLPFVYCHVSCSKGTYIRALANDIGERIGCGAYLSNLTRTRIGDYTLDEALTLSEIKYYREAGVLKRHVRQIESVLPFPSLQVDEKFSPGIVSGRSPRVKDIVDISGSFHAEELVALRDHTGKVMAIGRTRIGSDDLRDYKGKAFFTYLRVLN